VSCYEKPTGPCSRAQPGTLNLYRYVLARSPELAGNGVFVCRPPRGAASGFSAHAEGRAFDINAALPSGSPNGNPIPQGGQADVRLRYWIGLYVANWKALGVQRIIYQHEEWRCDRGWRATSYALGQIHLNHCHTEQTRAKARTLTTAEIAAAFSAAPAEEDDDMAGRLIVMVPGAPPSNVGRWQYWRLNGEHILSCNGAPPLEGSAPIFGIPAAPLPAGHRPILGIEPAPDGNGVVAIADDQGTFTFRVAQ